MARVSLSKIEEFVVNQCIAPFTVGVAVHKKSYAVTVLDSNGAMKSWTATSDPFRLVKQLKGWQMPIKCVAQEAGPTGFGLARALEEAGIKVIVAAPSRIPRQVTPGSKTDRLDSMALAQLAQKDMLRPIAIPSRNRQAMRCLVRRRTQLSKGIRQRKQQIKSFLLFNGIAEPAGLSSWSQRSRAELGELHFDEPGFRYTLDSLLLDLEHLESLRQVLDSQVKELLDGQEADRKAMACMQTTPGAGFVTAANFRLEIFDPERFGNKEEVVSLIGLAPVMRQSGTQKGRATLGKAGKKELRSLLVEAAWRLRAKEPWAKKFYDRILARTGTPQKAIVALARKLCIILWRICVEFRAYRPAAVG